MNTPSPSSCPRRIDYAPAHAPAPGLTRRRFIGSAAAGALSAATFTGRISAAPAGGIGETEHFLYRLASPEDPWVDSQRGDRAFGFREGKILLSEDNGKTWPHVAPFADAEKIQFSCLLDNGRVLFATERQLYRAEADLTGVVPLPVLDRDGNEYHPHPLREGEVPGWYFYPLDGINTFQAGGREIAAWGNYCNVGTGSVPVNIYYSADGGETVRLAYSFGRNPQFQHPDADPADWLGDPDNPTVCRHLHSVSYNPAEDAWYACSGDLDRENGAGKECHWLRGKYHPGDDRWEWKVVVSADANSRFKSGGINFVDGQAYWVADANGPKTLRQRYDRGIFRCDPADLPDKSKHQLLYPAEYEIAVMTIDEKIILVPEYTPATPSDCGFLYSPDLGETWGRYDLKEFGARAGVRVHPRNGEGWFRVQLMERWTKRAEVLWIQPK